MLILAAYRRKKYLLKLICVSGILATTFVFYNLLQFKLSPLPTEHFQAHNLTSTHEVDEVKDDFALRLYQSTFKGINKDLEPYLITANTVDKVAKDTFKLQAVTANYQFKANKLLINAQHGLLDNLHNLVHLTDDVHIMLNDVTLTTKEICLNLATKEAVSNNQIAIVYKNSQLTADKFTTANNSNIINFTGNVLAKIAVGDF